ncbi:MAG: CxxC-x17-CxxC domain-containing protein [Patescibacteria group bacterium]
MRDFDRGSSFGGNKKFGSRDGGRSFDRGGGRGFGDRDERPEMHKAICDECGKSCEVPFKPTSGKPVLCSDCFRNKGDRGPARDSGRRDFGGRDSGRRDSRDSRRSFGEDRPMFTAVCSKCGKSCEVPFRPTGDKPVYCSQCFEEMGNATPSSRNTTASTSGISKDQFETLNAKLDKIMKSLGLESAPKKEFVKEVVKEVKEDKKVKEVKVIEPKKPASKPAKKAVAVKKPVAKKVAKKKKA